MADRVQQPERSQSTTSLGRMYHGANGELVQNESTDPSLDFCNAFWGQDGRGYEVIMARLRGAARTVDELRAFWKERAAIEEDYAKRLSKLSKLPLGKDEVGDLQASLQSIQAETAAQASYHLQLSTELHQTVEQPTAEFGNRLSNLKKGLQASVEKSYRSKAMHEGHVAKARERYESDCLKLNSYTANMQLTQGKELEKLQSKIDRVQSTIGSNENDFKNFVSVLETTTQKWENEWRSFCDHVQDLEEDRLSVTKDIAWAYANAVSQVCVEDDSSCERIREKLEAFEPLTDMVNFVRGWGTGSQIPDPPRFINYGAGEYPTQPTSHIAHFQRLSNKAEPLQRTTAPRQPESEEPAAAQPPTTAAGPGQTAQPPQQRQFDSPQTPALEIPPVAPEKQDTAVDGLQRLSLRDEPAPPEPPKGTFGGIAMPGMAGGPTQPSGIPEFHAPGSQTSYSAAPERAPPSPSARDVEDDEDPMARALRDLRRDPPGPGRVRRGQSQRSQRRPDSAQRNDSVRAGSAAGAAAAAGAIGAGAYVAAQQFQRSASPAPGSTQQPQRAPSPAPSAHRASQQQAPSAQGSQVGSTYGSQVGAPGHQAQGSVDNGLLPPAGGHTAAALARSMADFERKSQNPQQGRNSVNYSNYATDVVGQHPSSRPASRASARSPSPSAAMMQAPTQPATHIADQVLPQYHQAFPGERSRSRPASVYSSASRPGSIMEPSQPSNLPPREGFVGIGAGNAARSPSPRPNSFRSPSPGPGGHGVLGPQNLGISLDERGGVAHDSMAEAYRREYQQRQQSQQGSQPPQSPPVQHQQQPDQRGSYQSFSGHQQQAPPPSQSPPTQPAQWRSQTQPNPYQHQSSMSQSSFSAPFSTQLGQQPQQYGQQPQQQAPVPQQQQQQPPHQAAQQQYGQYGQQAVQQHPQQAYQQHQQPPQPPAPQQYDQYGRPLQPQPQDQYAQHSYTSTAASYNVAGYGQHPQQQQQQPPPQAQPQAQPQQQYDPYYQNQNGYGGQQQAAYRAPSPQPAAQTYQQKARTPSPQPNRPPADMEPTGQWASNGKPVQFYVKAVYAYTAQSDQEFDFQQDDIIAVTDCPEDGWWAGELLDESRRVPGRTDFPSNFVTYF